MTDATRQVPATAWQAEHMRIFTDPAGHTFCVFAWPGT
jgi:hypothetical protein